MFKEIKGTVEKYVDYDKPNKVDKEPEIKTKVYLVFPALEDAVADSLKYEGSSYNNFNVLTLKLNSYHRTNVRTLKASDNIENTLWNTIKASNGIFDSLVLTDDLYVEKALFEHNIKYTLVYPESANKDEYLALLKEKGYRNSFIEQLKNEWSNFITAIPTGLNIQGAYTNYIKGSI